MPPQAPASGADAGDNAGDDARDDAVDDAAAAPPAAALPPSTSAGLDLVIADLLHARSCTACKVLCMRALALSAAQTDAEAIASDLAKAVAKAHTRIAARFTPLPSVQDDGAAGASGGRASATSLPAGWIRMARDAAAATAPAGRGGDSGGSSGGVAEGEASVLAAAAFIAHDEGRELFEETFVRSAGRKFMAALVLAAAATEAESSEAMGGKRESAVPDAEIVAMWLNLSASLLRRASGGGTGASPRVCRRALAAAAVALDVLCASAAVAETDPGSSSTADTASSMVELPGTWLPVIVQSTLPRLKQSGQASSAAAADSLRDPAEQTLAAEAGRSLAKAVARRGTEGHRLAVKALYRAGQALTEAGALRQAAACLRGGLVMCSLWVRMRTEESSATFDAMASAKRLRRELKRVRRLAAAIGAFE
jgi:hypothetical protein